MRGSVPDFAQRNAEKGVMSPRVREDRWKMEARA